jgi:hypothetical protein
MVDIKHIIISISILFKYFSASDLKVDGGYGAMSAEGHGEMSSFAGTSSD